MTWNHSGQYNVSSKCNGMLVTGAQAVLGGANAPVGPPPGYATAVNPK